jgi:hypothetical protein
MNGGDGDGHCGGGADWIGASEAGDGDGADAGHPRHPRPIDERPKINGEPTADISHELVIKRQNAQD